MHTIQTKNFEIQHLGDRAYFEHNHLGDECAALITFKDRHLVDYSGVSVIPAEVSQALQKVGYWM